MDLEKCVYSTPFESFMPCWQIHLSYCWTAYSPFPHLLLLCVSQRHGAYTRPICSNSRLYSLLFVACDTQNRIWSDNIWCTIITRGRDVPSTCCAARSTLHAQKREEKQIENKINFQIFRFSIRSFVFIPLFQIIDSVFCAQKVQ